MRISVKDLSYVIIVLLITALPAGCSQSDSSSIKAAREDKSNKGTAPKDLNTKTKKSSTTSTSSNTAKIDTMTIDVPPPPAP